ncbi:MAG: tyrosine-type recombinase/integrase [Chromatiales bacterium]|nr:tyrosine-type recombinase/integrase [Chromatiales bacterium]
MALSDLAVRTAKPGPKPRKLYDERGLFLLVNPTGSKWWRLKYRFADREKLLSLGTYPDVSLKDARDRRDQARQQLVAGLDPGEARKAAKVAAQADLETFKSIACEWLQKRSPLWADGHAEKIRRRLDLDVFPRIGGMPIAAVTAPELLKMAKLIESRGAIDTAHRAVQNCGQIIRYAIATGRAISDPTPALRGALTPTRERHYSSITEPKAVGALLRAIDGYGGSYVTRAALRLAPLVFVRPGELRKAEWSEFDLDNAEWRIPAARMKMRQPHVVPLARQALDILTELKPVTGNGVHVFPGARGRGRHMSENTVNAALRRLGFAKEDMTGHGFRSMASTLLNEQGWHRDAIERQLAHQERDAIRAAYNYAEHLPERRKMMQAWADYLDDLRTGAKVIQIRANQKT